MNSTWKVSLRKKLRFESPDIKYDNSDTGTDESVASDENYEYAEESSSDIKLSDSSQSEDDITDNNDSDEN